eukprot:4673754-Amphidinium_carterae.1
MRRSWMISSQKAVALNLQSLALFGQEKHMRVMICVGTVCKSVLWQVKQGQVPLKSTIEENRRADNIDSDSKTALEGAAASAKKMVRKHDYETLRDGTQEQLVPYGVERKKESNIVQSMSSTILHKLDQKIVFCPTQI